MSQSSSYSTMTSSTCLTKNLPEIINDLDNVRQSLDNRKNGTLMRNVRILSFENFRKATSKRTAKKRKAFPKIKSTFFSSLKESSESNSKYEFKSFLF